MTTRSAAHAAAQGAPPPPPGDPTFGPSSSAYNGAPNAPLHATDGPLEAPFSGSIPEASTTGGAASAVVASAAAAVAATAATAATAMTTQSGARRAMTRGMLAMGASGGGGGSTVGKLGRPHSSKFGTVNYSIDEMRRLNDKVRAVMPIGADDWLHVAYQFNYLRPESIPYREVESLKRKFKKMYCSRATVGGRLPDYVEDAKELRRLINQRSERAQIQLEHGQSDTQSDVGDAPTTGVDGAGAETTALSGAIAAPAATGVDDTSSSSSGIVRAPQAPTGSRSGATYATVDTTAASGDSNNDSSSNNNNNNNDDDGNGSGNGSGTGRGGGGDGAVAPGEGPTMPPPTSSVVGIDPTEVPTFAPHEETREISARLRQMEEDYHRTMAAGPRGRTTTGGGTSAELTGLYNVDPGAPGGGVAYGMGAMAMAMAPGLGLAPPAAAPLDSTAGIINMLKHSIERKRRTIEEQMLSESERVRKERKKRKMEQALYNIHREHELSVTGGAGAGATSAVEPATGPSTAPPAAAAYLPPAAPGSLPSGTHLPPAFMEAHDPSLGAMEVVLQYVMAQQHEAARRQELEEERRRRDAAEKERRRRLKDQRRRRDKRELMLVMAALLQDRFPQELHHYLEPERLEEEEQAIPPSSSTAEDMVESLI